MVSAGMSVCAPCCTSRDGLHSECVCEEKSDRARGASLGAAGAASRSCRSPPPAGAGTCSRPGHPTVAQHPAADSVRRGRAAHTLSPHSLALTLTVSSHQTAGCGMVGVHQHTLTLALTTVEQRKM